MTKFSGFYERYYITHALKQEIGSFSQHMNFLEECISIKE